MGSIVMVTGGTGYVGSWIVRALLEKGYTVRAAIRNKSNISKVRHLLDIEAGTPGHLELWEADLLAEGSFNDAARGAQYVIHTASPFTLHFKDAQRELIDPALKGTANVLNAATGSGSVQKVILTSSVAAVHGDNIDMSAQKLSEFSENQFNTTSSLNHQPYSFSKVLAEKAAWQLAEAQTQWQLVAINPAFVMGPPLNSRSGSESLTLMKALLGGKYKTGIPDLKFGFVDVRDVAQAHILAMENDHVEGRYILSAEVCSLYDLAQQLKSIYGKKYPLPVRKVPKFLISLLAPLFGLNRRFVRRNVGYPLQFNTTKSRASLQLSYRPLLQTLEDMVGKMEKLGMVQ
ncbi:MAG TPA: NAD-dependent epimerase/dehydratase family protein [Edaphocola sp.]|nr:NAD-dependent epimerase/dehydratase family protein [Edaphocola sp.]